MCMGGSCKWCGAACKAPEPKTGVDRGKRAPEGSAGDRVTGDGLGPLPAGAGWVAKKKAAEAAVAKARSKR
jgi:hypothetical protein